MGISDLLDTPPGGTPAPRLTPRSPISVKELIAIATLAALAWGAYDKLNKFAEKSSVDKVVETQWLMRMEAQHDRDEMRASLKDINDKLEKAADVEKKISTRR